MPRTVSLTALQSMLAQQVDEVFLKIIEVDHADLDEPLRLVADRQSLTRTEGTYQPFGFTIELPEEDEENIRTVNLVIPIVDQAIVEALRSTNDPITVTLTVVREAAPNTDEVGPFVFESLGVNFEGNVTTITLGVSRNIFEDAYPKDIFSPSNRVVG